MPSIGSNVELLSKYIVVLWKNIKGIAALREITT